MVSFIKSFILDWIPMLSISLASCEVKENMESVQCLVDEVHDLPGDLDSNSCLSFAEAEDSYYRRHTGIRSKVVRDVC